MSDASCLNGCQDDDGNPVRTEGKRWVCDECHRRFRRLCADIPTLYALLPYVLESGSVPGEPGHHGKKPYPPMPMRPDVADLRDERREGRGDEARGVLGCVEGWARIVREERDLTWPDHPTIVSEAGLLLTHSEWVVEHKWVRDCMAELQAEHRALAHACGEHGVKPVATCRTLIDQDAAIGEQLPSECGGPILPTRIGMGAQCARCKRYWGEHELTRLGLVEAS